MWAGLDPGGGHPVAGGGGIGHGLDGGKGLGGDDHKGRRRVQPRQRVGDIGPVNVRHEMTARPVVIGAQRPHGHLGAQMRAADADVDDIGDRPLPDVSGKLCHACARGGDFRHDVRALDHHRSARQIAQRAVQDGPPLGLVDRRALEHGGAACGNAGRLCKTDQSAAGRGGQGGLGVIQ